MSRMNYVFRELGRHLYRFPGTIFAALLSLTLLFLLFNLFWIAASTSEQLYDRLLSDLRMEAFLDEGLNEVDVPMVRSNIANMEGIAGVEYISREQARKILWSMLGTDMLVGYDSTNPLPRSLVLELDPDFLNVEDMDRMQMELLDRADIADVAYSRKWLNNAEQTRGIILQVGLVLGALIVLTALFSSITNIRLMTGIRAVGFQQMRLLGAGKLFLALPFLIEGFTIGGLSAVFSWIAIMYAHQKISFTQFEIVLPAIEEIAIYCTATAILGVISGYLGIRKSLS